MKKHGIRRTTKRSQKGAALGSLMFSSTLLGCLLGASISVDISHQNAVRTELQAATDAAALAGEEILLAQGNTSQATSAASTVCDANYADGYLISANDKAVVTVNPTYSASNPGASTVQVTCKVPVHNLFSSMFGRPTDTMVATSTAGAGAQNIASTPAWFGVIQDQNYQPGSSYTWYISSTPGFVPGLVNGLGALLTGSSAGSYPSPAGYPYVDNGYNTARFISTSNSLNGGLVYDVGGILNVVNTPIGLGQAGSVVVNVVSPILGSVVSGAGLLGSILTGGVSYGSAGLSSLDMAAYYNTSVSSSPSNGQFQLSQYTAVPNNTPMANGASFPNTQGLVPSALQIGEQVLLTTGMDSSNSSPNMVAQFMQGPTGNSGITTVSNKLVNGSGSVSSDPTGSTLKGSVASWLNGQILNVPLLAPSSSNPSLALLNLNLLGTNVGGSNHNFSTTDNGLLSLGGLTQALTGSTAAPSAATITGFIGIKVTGVTVQYNGANGLNLLGLTTLLGEPWANQTVAITGQVVNQGFAGYGSSASNGSGAITTGAYAAMLIQ